MNKELSVVMGYLDKMEDILIDVAMKNGGEHLVLEFYPDKYKTSMETL